jgi:hypothetical protein
MVPHDFQAIAIPGLLLNRSRVIAASLVFKLRLTAIALSSALRYSLSRLWDCKVSVTSVLAGFALMALFPEARDLFNDRIGTLGLVEYTALVLFVWSLQVWHSAKSAIAAKPRLTASHVADGETLYEVELPRNDSMRALWRRRVDAAYPIILGLLTFVAVWAGIFLSRQDILVCEHIATAKRLRSCLGYAFTQDLGDFQSAQEAARTAGWVTPDYSLPEVGESLGQLGTLAILVTVAAFVLLAVALRLDRGVASFIDNKLARPRQDGNEPKISALTNERLASANIVLMGLLFAWAFYWPFELTDWAGRASLIPILLGSWVPLVDCLAGLSCRIQRRIGLRWPIATTAVVALVVASTYVGRFHDVRLYRTSHWQAAQARGDDTSKATPRQIYLEQAIDRWMSLNGCADRPAECRMVLVAAEGGASRSAFFTATVLGALLDATRSDPEKYIDFAQATFVLSGVSGGALGVATFRTALIESAGRAPPCRELDGIWFGARAGEKARPDRDPSKSWRACLQLLTAGDYLSPAIVGLSFRDHFALLVPSDRSVLLEQGIERHYNKVVHGAKTACEGPQDERGFCRAFGYVRSDDSKEWRPLLLLNATSMENGRPVLVSDIHTPVVSPDARNCKNLFVVAQNAFELYATNPFKPTEIVADVMGSCVYPNLEVAADMRLSTATVLSARFPIISPAGSFRYEDSFRNLITDHVVDGGYFDNSGLETVNQILPVLASKGLQPIVLYLTNEPWFFKETERAGRPHSTPSVSRILTSNLDPPQQAIWSSLLSWIEVAPVV